MQSQTMQPMYPRQPMHQMQVHTPQQYWFPPQTPMMGEWNSPPPPQREERRAQNIAWEETRKRLYEETRLEREYLHQLTLPQIPFWRLHAHLVQLSCLQTHIAGMRRDSLIDREIFYIERLLALPHRGGLPQRLPGDWRL